MSKRIDKVNRLIQETLGEVLQREAELPADVMVTISGVETTHNLQGAQVWLSILPEEKADEVMQVLRKQLYDLQGSLNRKLNIKPLPRISLKVDHGGAYAENINQKLAGLAGE